MNNENTIPVNVSEQPPTGTKKNVLLSHCHDENDSSTSSHEFISHHTATSNSSSNDLQSIDFDSNKASVCKIAQEETVSISQCRHTASLMDDKDDDDLNDDVDMKDLKDMSHTIQHDEKIEHENHLDELSHGNDKSNNHDENVTTIQDLNTLNGSSFTSSSPELSTTMLYPFSNHLYRPLQQKPHNWDHFVRSGKRLKALLVDTIGEVKSTIDFVQSKSHNIASQKRVRDCDDGIDQQDTSDSNQQSHVVTVADFTVELAREKTAQVLQLQRVSLLLYSFYSESVLRNLRQSNGLFFTFLLIG
jgi:hypothetical protein